VTCITSTMTSLVQWHQQPTRGSKIYFIDSFKLALHVSDNSFTHLQEHFVYTVFWNNVPTVLSAAGRWRRLDGTLSPVGSRQQSRYIVPKSCTGLLKMIFVVLTTCHTQYTWDRSICVFLFNRTTLQDFVTYLTGALYVHPLWFYKHQHDNR